MISNADPTWCRCLVLGCSDCDWEGDQRGADLHYRLTGDLVGRVVAPLCGETPCRSLARSDTPT